MHVSTIKITDVRGFTGGRDVELTLPVPGASRAGWIVIAGRNGSGKTSLLRAIALGIRDERVASVFLRDSDWISSGKTEARVTIEVTDEGGGFKRTRWWRQQWRNAPDTGLDVDVDPGLLEGKGLQVNGPRKSEKFEGLCAGYGPFRRFGAEPAQPVERKAAAIATLFDENASLNEGVGWLTRHYYRSEEGHNDSRAIFEAAIRVLGDGLLPDGYKIVRVDTDGLWVERDTHISAMRQMSDGYRAVAALVLDLISRVYDVNGTVPIEGTTITAPGVVLIDEVEAHLHVSWQKWIGRWLTQHFPNVQFLVTTHSPYVCQSASRGGLIRLSGPNDPPEAGGAAHAVDDDLYRRVVYGTGDDAVLSELFGMNTTYSKDAQALRSELVELEVRVLDGNADERQLTRYVELKAELSSSLEARVGEVAARLELPES